MEKKLRAPIAAIMLAIFSLLRLFQLTDICMELFHYKLNSNFFTIASILIDLVLCFLLFAKKRNNLLCIILGCAALLNIIPFNGGISIVSFLNFIAYGILFVMAISFSNQTLIKADITKIKELSGKLYFLPAVLHIVAFFINISNVLELMGGFVIRDLIVRNIVSCLFSAIILLSVGQWLKDPCSKAVKVSDNSSDGNCDEYEYEEAYCGLGKHIVLCLFTFGIWHLIWTYRTTKYLNKAPNAVQYNPTSKLLLCMFIPFYQIYWFYKHGQRLDAMSKQKKLNNSDMATLCLILGIFIPIVACILMQDRINILCTTKAVVEEKKVEDSSTEQIKKYKDLLDSGVISQEEFDAKKKQLLGL